MKSVGDMAAGSCEWRAFFAGLVRRDLEVGVLRLVASLVMRSSGDGEVEVVEVEVRRRVGLKVGSSD